jgi:hypothetical protein
MHIVDPHGSFHRFQDAHPAALYPTPFIHLPATVLAGTPASVALPVIARAYLAAMGQPSPVAGFLIAMAVELCGALLRLPRIRNGFDCVLKTVVMIIAAGIFLVADGERDLPAEPACRQAMPGHWRPTCASWRQGPAACMVREPLQYWAALSMHCAISRQREGDLL